MVTENNKIDFNTKNWVNNNLNNGAGSQLIKKYGIGWYFMLLDKHKKK